MSLIKKNRGLYNLLWFVKEQLGINPKSLINTLKYTLRYFIHYLKFQSNYSGKLSLKPCLQDFHDYSGQVNEYTMQDLFVSQKIFKANPNKHVDIGSRIDGFSTSVAAYRSLEIFDIRPLDISDPNILFKKVDIFGENIPFNYCDSLSCLHTIEHFGLGRYGDQIHSQPLEKGLKILAQILQLNGFLYLSTLAGEEKVEFNANWIFDYKKLLVIANTYNLKLIESFYYDSEAKIVKPIENSGKNLDKNYNLVILIFQKIKE